MSLTNQQKKKLKAFAHSLNPVVRIGQLGLTDSVLDEIESAISHHELIKIKVAAADRAEKNSLIKTISEKTQSDIIQQIGFVAVFYRLNPDKNNYS